MVSLDYPKQQLRMRHDILPDADGDRLLAYTSPHGIPVIPVRIGGRTYEARLDSGSPGSLDLPLAHKDSVRLAGALTEVGGVRTANSEIVVYGGQIADTMRIGGHAFPQALVQFKDELPHANLGGRVLREFVNTLDQKNRRVRFDRTGRPAIAPRAQTPAPAPSAPKTTSTGRARP